MADEVVAQKDALAVEFGRRGGKARMRNLSPEQRRDIARRAAQARWGKKADAPDPNSPLDPKPHRDEQFAEAGIMSSPRRRPSVRVSSDQSPARSRALAS